MLYVRQIKTKNLNVSNIAVILTIHRLYNSWAAAESKAERMHLKVCEIKGDWLEEDMTDCDWIMNETVGH